MFQFQGNNNDEQNKKKKKKKTKTVDYSKNVYQFCENILFIFRMERIEIAAATESSAVPGKYIKIEIKKKDLKIYCFNCYR